MPFYSKKDDKQPDCYLCSGKHNRIYCPLNYLLQSVPNTTRTKNTNANQSTIVQTPNSTQIQKDQRSEPAVDKPQTSSTIPKQPFTFRLQTSDIKETIEQQQENETQQQATIQRRTLGSVSSPQ